LRYFGPNSHYVGELQKTVIIGEELTLVREGFAALCDAHPKFRVVGQCGDGARAFELIEKLTPDVAVLDLSLERMYVIELSRRVRQQRQLPTQVVLLSVRKDRKLVIEALRCGVSGFVLKSSPGAELIEALEQVVNGGMYVSPALEIQQAFLQDRRYRMRDPLDSLSAREYQVFSLLVEGVRAKEIASRLDLSPKTVDTYRASLMRKLDIYDVAGLVKYAIKRDMMAAVAVGGR
jgi:DNA-binding NarL/FixJ family response regulator